jgi:hypothetical protein
VTAAVQYFIDSTRGVVYLNDSYSVEFNIKFNTDIKVIIKTAKLIEREQLLNPV